MKNKKVGIVLIILLSVLSISLITFMINAINGNINFSKFRLFSKVSNELVLNEIYDINFTKINIDSSASNIYIKESEDNQIKVVIYGDKENTDVKINNTELSIVTREKSCAIFCFNNMISKIEIYLPKDYENYISIINNYGDIEVGQFLNADIKVEADCGNVQVLGGNNVDVKNDYGNITVDEANNATINESAGNIELGIVNNVVAENSYGDINIKKINNYLEVTNDCGDINIDNISLNKNSSIASDLGKVKIGSTNEIYIDAETDLGKVKINKNYHNSDITLTIENDCGDIVVNN